MATVNVNGVRLFYEMNGSGEVPLVLVHGSWVSHHDWDLVVPRLADSFRILTYDRRGHSESERPSGQRSVHEDVEDLAALIQHLDLAPAWICGNSFGSSITLRLAVEHPDLLRGIVAHEPPLFAVLANDPAAAPILEEVGARVGSVVERIASGDHAGAAEQFVDELALGPGSWANLPSDIQQTFIQNAPTFMNECGDPDQLAFDPHWIRAVPVPVLLTTGGQSPPVFAPVIEVLANASPKVEALTIPGAGHIPQVTHPDAFVEALSAFISSNST